MEASVSVIIPCYRCSDTVRRAVDSVVKQTLQPSEIILIDDGSEDNTLAVLYELQHEYGKNWLKVIALESNYGPSVARNTGWELASQDYIAFLDADDIWHPDKLAIQYSWMLAHQHVSLSGHVYPLDLSTTNYDTQLSKNFSTHKVTIKEILLFNPFITPSVILKRSLNYRFPPQKRYCEDHFLWMQMCLDNHELYVLDIQLTYLMKSFGSSGLTRNLLKMRLGYISNCWILWKEEKIFFPQMFFLISYSTLKAIPLFIFGNKAYSNLKRIFLLKAFKFQK